MGLDEPIGKDPSRKDPLQELHLLSQAPRVGSPFWQSIQGKSRYRSVIR